MVNHKDIESALVEVIKVSYSKGTGKYDKLGASYDHIRYVAKQQTHLHFLIIITNAYYY